MVYSVLILEKKLEVLSTRVQGEAGLAVRNVQEIYGGFHQWGCHKMDILYVKILRNMDDKWGTILRKVGSQPQGNVPLIMDRWTDNVGVSSKVAGWGMLALNGGLVRWGNPLQMWDIPL